MATPTPTPKGPTPAQTGPTFNQTAPDAVTAKYPDGHTAILTTSEAIALGFKSAVGSGQTSSAGTPTPGNMGTGIQGINNVTLEGITKPIADWITYAHSNTSFLTRFTGILADNGYIHKSQINDPNTRMSKFSEFLIGLSTAQAQPGTTAMTADEYLKAYTINAGARVGALNVDAAGAKIGASAEQQLQDFANNNNLTFTPDQIGNYAQTVKDGTQSLEQIKQNLRDTIIAHSFPAWADQIKAGTDVNTLASPYMQQLATTLEIPISSIQPNDPRVLKGMQAVDANGKPAYMPLWQFNQAVVKQDPSYQYTKSAWTDMTDKFGSLLSSLGIQNPNLPTSNS